MTLNLPLPRSNRDSNLIQLIFMRYVLFAFPDSGSKTLTLSPRSGIMLGGTNVKMSGPCFTADDNIVVQIDNEININVTFGSELQSSVTVPVLNKTGRLPIKLSIDGGNSFDYSGVYTSGNFKLKYNLLANVTLNYPT